MNRIPVPLGGGERKGKRKERRRARSFAHFGMWRERKEKKRKSWVTVPGFWLKRGKGENKSFSSLSLSICFYISLGKYSVFSCLKAGFELIH